MPNCWALAEEAVCVDCDAVGFGDFAEVVSEEVGDHVEFGCFFG